MTKRFWVDWKCSYFELLIFLCPFPDETRPTKEEAIAKSIIFLTFLCAFNTWKLLSRESFITLPGIFLHFIRLFSHLCLRSKCMCNRSRFTSRLKLILTQREKEALSVCKKIRFVACFTQRILLKLLPNLKCLQLVTWATDKIFVNKPANRWIGLRNCLSVCEKNIFTKAAYLNNTEDDVYHVSCVLKYQKYKGAFENYCICKIYNSNLNDCVLLLISIIVLAQHARTAFGFCVAPDIQMFTCKYSFLQVNGDA